MITALLLAATLSPFDQVVAAERAFAAASLEKGHHQAFLLNLAPDAIGFLPLPGPARPAHEGQPPTAIKLAWGPTWVAVSSAGDLALSTGPWKVSHHEASPIPVSTGWFFSVWLRQPDGAYKVAVDAGIASPVAFKLPKTVEDGLAGRPIKEPRKEDAASARMAVTRAENALSLAAKSGLGKAISSRSDAGLRVYREGKAAGIDPASARALLGNDNRNVTCAPDKVIAAASGDLAYAYGTCTGEAKEADKKYGFLHVWRRQADGTFKILADVTP